MFRKWVTGTSFSVTHTVLLFTAAEPTRTRSVRRASGLLETRLRQATGASSGSSATLPEPEVRVPADSDLVVHGRSDPVDSRRILRQSGGSRKNNQNGPHKEALTPY